MVSVPVVKDGVIEGYFLTRLVYTVEPHKMAMLSVPAETLDHRRGLFLRVRQPRTSISSGTTRSTSTRFAPASATAINKRVGDELVQEVLVEQIDFLTKDEIRDNTIRRRMSAGASERAVAKTFQRPLSRLRRVPAVADLPAEIALT